MPVGDSTPSIGAVYFIRAGRRGPIKIGYSGDVAKRLGALSSQSPLPLDVLGIISPASRSTENLLHRRFREHRLYGEWFRANRELLDFIKAETKTVATERRKPRGFISLARSEFARPRTWSPATRPEPQPVPKRGRRRSRSLPEPETIRRRAAVLIWQTTDHAAADVADAFGVTSRTLRRWARQLASQD
jgi:hypothetical protein